MLDIAVLRESTVSPMELGFIDKGEAAVIRRIETWWLRVLNTFPVENGMLIFALVQ